MLRFDSDYMEGCHTDILKNLVEANFEKKHGLRTRHSYYARQRINQRII